MRYTHSSRPHAWCNRPRTITAPCSPVVWASMHCIHSLPKGKFMRRIPSSLLAAIAILTTGVLFVTLGSLRSGPTGDSPTEVELITLRPAGFEPSEIVRPKGAFVLFIDDRSGRENSSLVLQRVNSERLRAISLYRKKSEWNDVVDLSPGNYVLQDASNSDLRCQITILP